MRFIKITENTCLIITDKYSYTFTIDKINKYNCKQYVMQQKELLKECAKLKLITQQDRFKVDNALENWFKHCSHSMINVAVQNLETKVIRNYSVSLTQRGKDVEIIRSISEDMLGEKTQHFSVIKIANDLYIPSHFLIIDVSNNDKLNFNHLKYDEDKDCYVDVSNQNKIYFKNLTQDNIKKVFINIVYRMESDEIIKVDITNSGNPLSDIIIIKNIEKWQEGFFDKISNNTYKEVGEKIDEFNADIIKKINDLKLNMNIEKINKKIEDEL